MKDMNVCLLSLMCAVRSLLEVLGLVIYPTLFKVNKYLDADRLAFRATCRRF